MPHGGGVKIEPDKLWYQLVHRWIAEGGNFRDEATGKQSGENIPHLDRSFDEWSQALTTTLPWQSD